MLGLYEGLHSGKRKQKQRDLFLISLIQKSELDRIRDDQTQPLYSKDEETLKKKSTFKQKLYNIKKVNK